MNETKLQKLVTKLGEMDNAIVQEANTIVRDEFVVVKRYPAVHENPAFFRARDELRKSARVYRWNSFR